VGRRDGVLCVFSQWGDREEDRLPEIEFAVRRTVIHFSFWDALKISIRLRKLEYAILDRAPNSFSNGNAGCTTHTMK
jgi:hypothetical protein